MQRHLGTPIIVENASERQQEQEVLDRGNAPERVPKPGVRERKHLIDGNGKGHSFANRVNLLKDLRGGRTESRQDKNSVASKVEDQKRLLGKWVSKIFGKKGVVT